MKTIFHFFFVFVFIFSFSCNSGSQDTPQLEESEEVVAPIDDEGEQQDQEACRIMIELHERMLLIVESNAPSLTQLLASIEVFSEALKNFLPLMEEKKISLELQKEFLKISEFLNTTLKSGIKIAKEKNLPEATELAEKQEKFRALVEQLKRE